VSQRKSAHILFMDDLIGTVAPAIAFMTAEGYRVSYVSTEDQALAAIRVGDVDLSILDVDLVTSEQIAIRRAEQMAAGLGPEVSEEKAGYRVAAWARAHTPHVGVIMYSSQKTDPDDQIEGLNQGADDYVLKSDGPKLLLARVESVLRRRRFSLGSHVTFDDFELDLGSKTAKLPGGDVRDLTDAEFRLLETFIMSPRRNLGREVLYEAAFRTLMPTDHDRGIDTLVSNLRRKLANPVCEFRLKTIHGVGYRLEADVSYKW
jgi:DNA-binding response OmpR family regulator